MNYKEFLERKSQIKNEHGFEPLWVPDFLFDFQKYLVDWSLKKGRAAIFADCGLGKTPMQLVWAKNVQMKTKKPVLILTPLAVTRQTIEEGNKFGINVQKYDGRDFKEHEYSDRIIITNYEQLHKLDYKNFGGVVCDESSILKNFDGKLKDLITKFMRKIQYRSLWTATAAPNDYIELGTSSEALGNMGYMDMLTKFFKNNNNTVSTKSYHGKQQKWLFKGHAEEPFWKWVSSWAKAIRKPSDFGFEDNGFNLPAIEEENHIIKNTKPQEGMLFNMPAKTLPEQRQERRRTIKERCEKVAELVDTGKPAIVWCNLNDEGDMLEKLIPDAKQVAGKHSDQIKEDRLIGFKNNEFRVLITKPKIGAWGLNYQHCSHMTYFPSHSYEAYYQALHRLHRFGQKEEVKVDFVTTEGDEFIFKNLKTKSKQADKMFQQLIKHMNNEIEINKENKFTNQEKLPTWL